MGHVDHGKTTLLDAIRETSVASGEAGGITQHIGAYQVKIGDRKVTFLDTPGHEAFTALRARGAKVTDVAVLVVAADDGVMPQTIEAMDHAKAAEVPIVVAVNKIDRPDANPTRRCARSSSRTACSPRSGAARPSSSTSRRSRSRASTTLLEMLLLQADVLELKANSNAEASGPIIESRLDVGRGPVATMLVQRGTLHAGRRDRRGRRLGQGARDARRERRARRRRPGRRRRSRSSASTSRRPPARSRRVVDSDRTARQMAQKRAARLRTEALTRRSKSVSLEDLFERMQEGAIQELNLVIKGDVQGSVEAAQSASSQKLKHDEVAVRVIHTGIGAHHRVGHHAARPRRRRSWSASTCGRTPRRARSPSARASTSARTASSTS